MFISVLVIFHLPIIFAVLCIAFLTACIWAAAKSKNVPDCIAGEKQNKCRFLAWIFGITALVSLAVAIGVTVLIFHSVEYM